MPGGNLFLDVLYRGSGMKQYTQFIILMILVLILVIVMTYNATQNTMCKSNRGSSERFQDEEAEPPNLLAKRVSDIIYVMHDLTFHPIINPNDVNAMYQLWYSTMNKRGIPAFYATPDLFTTLHTDSIKGTLTPSSVETAIMPYYHREVDMIRNPPPAMQPFRPVCMGN